MQCFENADCNNPCQKKACRHHVLWNDLKLPSKAKETDTSRKFGNCICNLSHGLTLEAIAEIYGMTRENIRLIERKALIHLMKLIPSSPVADWLEEIELRSLSLNRDILISKQQRMRERRANWNRDDQGLLPMS